MTLTNQAILAKIAVEDQAPKVRKSAVEKLTDQALLAKIAVEDQDSEVRSSAVYKLTDQALLAKIAVEDKDWRVRKPAVHTLTDQAILAEIAKDRSNFLRSEAVLKLTDEKLLTEFVLTEKGEVAYAAFKRLFYMKPQTRVALIMRLLEESIPRSKVSGNLTFAATKMIEYVDLTKWRFEWFRVEHGTLVLRFSTGFSGGPISEGNSYTDYYTEISAIHSENDFYVSKKDTEFYHKAEF